MIYQLTLLKLFLQILNEKIAGNIFGKSNMGSCVLGTEYWDAYWKMVIGD